MSIKTAKEIFNANAELYEKKFMYLDVYNQTYDALCGLLKPDAKLLEIGCGPGNITRYLLDKRPDLTILATDFAEEMVKLCAKHNPEAICEMLDCRDVSALEKMFDAVVIGFCVPYLSMPECEKLIADSAHLLNPNGLIYLSTIDDDYSNSKVQMSSDGKMGTMVYKYREQDFTRIFAENNIDVIEIFRKPFPSGAEKNDTHLIVIAGKR